MGETVYKPTWYTSSSWRVSRDWIVRAFSLFLRKKAIMWRHVGGECTPRVTKRTVSVLMACVGDRTLLKGDNDAAAPRVGRNPLSLGSRRVASMHFRETSKYPARDTPDGNRYCGMSREKQTFDANHQLVETTRQRSPEQQQQLQSQQKQHKQVDDFKVPVFWFYCIILSVKQICPSMSLTMLPPVECPRPWHNKHTTPTENRDRARQRQRAKTTVPPELLRAELRQKQSLNGLAMSTTYSVNHSAKMARTMGDRNKDHNNTHAHTLLHIHTNDRKTIKWKKNAIDNVCVSQAEPRRLAGSLSPSVPALQGRGAHGARTWPRCSGHSPSAPPG